MRHGLADVRNYDSVELEGALAWIEPVFEPSTASRSSRRDVSWPSSARAIRLLRESCIGAVVGATPPPPGLFDRVERIGRVWVAWVEAEPWASVGSKAADVAWCRRPGWARIRLRLDAPDRLIVRETYVPGWAARVDGRAAAIEAGPGAFASLSISSGEHEIEWFYDPPEVRIGLAISGIAAVAWILALTGSRRK